MICSLRREAVARWGLSAKRRYACILSLTFLHSLPGWSQSRPNDLTGYSIEDLMHMEVTSVAKKAQKLSQTAAAITVITPAVWDSFCAFFADRKSTRLNSSHAN